jgi:hypothetical protein
MATDATTVGRLPADEVGDEHLLDNPTKAFSALLTKVDELTAALKGIADKLDADGGVTDTTYGSLWTDAIAELKFRL